MATLRALIILLLFSSASFAEEIEMAFWKPQWNFDPMDDSVSCSLFSNQFYFRGQFGANGAYIGVQDNGAVTIQSEKDVFDPRVISKFGIRVGEKQAVMHPDYISSKLVRFSVDKSKQIIEQLYVGDFFNIQVAFFPDGKLVNKKIHVGRDFTSFQSAINSKNFCSQIKNSEGWVGIAFTNMGDAESYVEFVKSNSKFSNPGVIVWSVNPKKEGSKSGLENFDIVLGFNSEPVDTPLLLKKLDEMKSGETAELNILRGNSFKNIKLSMP